MPITIAIIEDEQIHSDHLIECIDKWSASSREKVSVRHFESGREFESENEPYLFDGFFIDIMLPDCNGMELAERIRESGYESNPIVFVTNTSRYVHRGYDVNAINYIMKPIQQDALDKCMRKMVSALLPQKTDQRFSFKCDGMQRFILFHEVLYFQSKDHYIKVFTTHGTYLFRGALRELRDQLPDDFIQCNKSCIFNVKYIHTKRGNTLTLMDQTELLVSDSFAETVNKGVCKYFVSYN